MNETMQAILARRSYKAFEGRAIEPAILSDILTAGMYAPCGMNRQPWHFSVIQSEEAKSLLGSEIRAAMSRLPAGFKFPPPPPNVTVLPEDTLRGAPLAILVSGDDAAFTAEADCILAMGNMFIAAASHGVMSGWTNIVVTDVCSDPAVARKLGVPEGFTVYAAAFFGYPLGQPKDRGPRKDGMVTTL